MWEHYQVIPDVFSLKSVELPVRIPKHREFLSWVGITSSLRRKIPFLPFAWNPPISQHRVAWREINVKIHVSKQRKTQIGFISFQEDPEWLCYQTFGVLESKGAGGKGSMGGGTVLRNLSLFSPYCFLEFLGTNSILLVELNDFYSGYYMLSPEVEASEYSADKLFLHCSYSLMCLKELNQDNRKPMLKPFCSPQWFLHVSSTFSFYLYQCWCNIY